MANQPNGWEDSDEIPTPTERPQRPKPKWLKFAQLELGVHELAGLEHNTPRIQEYLRTVGLPFAPDEVPWCAAFVNFCLQRAQVIGTNRPNARAFEHWGSELTEPRVGAITVFSRPPDPAHGHVAFYLGQTDANVIVLGGNQGNKVCIADYSKERLLSYRWPLGWP